MKKKREEGLSAIAILLAIVILMVVLVMGANWIGRNWIRREDRPVRQEFNMLDENILE